MGGSVRIPASFCGIVGLKPSFGRIPLDFLPTQFDTIHHFGPLARTIADAQLFLDVAQGPDDRDIMSLGPALDLSGQLDSSAKALRLALDVDLGCYAVDPEVEATVCSAAGALADAGAEVEEVDLGWTGDLALAWLAHGAYLAAIFGDALEEFRDRMDPNVVSLMDAGLKMSAVDFKRLEFVRTDAWKRLRRSWSATTHSSARRWHTLPRRPTRTRTSIPAIYRRPVPRARHDGAVQLREPVPGAECAGRFHRRGSPCRSTDRRAPVSRRPGARDRGCTRVRAPVGARTADRLTFASGRVPGGLDRGRWHLPSSPMP